MAYFDQADSGQLWAERRAQRLLEPLGTRWRQTQGWRSAREAGRALEPDDAGVLVAARYLHDVGYGGTRGPTVRPMTRSTEIPARSISWTGFAEYWRVTLEHWGSEPK